jgi:hypothetical protein
VVPCALLKRLFDVTLSASYSIVGVGAAVLVVGADVSGVADRQDAVRPRVALSAMKTELQQPEDVVVRWTVDGAAEAFISGIGIVSQGVGEKSVRVSSTTRYAIVAESGGQLASAAVTVVVRGIRSEQVPVDLTYVQDTTDTVKATSLARVVSAVHSLLQNKLRYRVTGPLVDGNTTTLTSSIVEVPELLSPADRGVAARRVSYRVSISPAGRQLYNYSIGTAVQFRRRVERSWYPESSDSSMLRRATDLLRGHIGNLDLN